MQFIEHNFKNEPMPTKGLVSWVSPYQMHWYSFLYCQLNCERRERQNSWVPKRLRPCHSVFSTGLFGVCGVMGLFVSAGGGGWPNYGTLFLTLGPSWCSFCFVKAVNASTVRRCRVDRHFKCPTLSVSKHKCTQSYHIVWSYSWGCFRWEGIYVVVGSLFHRTTKDIRNFHS